MPSLRVVRLEGRSARQRAQRRRPGGHLSAHRHAGRRQSRGARLGRRAHERARRRRRPRGRRGVHGRCPLRVRARARLVHIAGVQTAGRPGADRPAFRPAGRNGLCFAKAAWQSAGGYPVDMASPKTRSSSSAYAPAATRSWSRHRPWSTGGPGGRWARSTSSTATTAAATCSRRRAQNELRPLALYAAGAGLAGRRPRPPQARFCWEPARRPTWGCSSPRRLPVALPGTGLGAGDQGDRRLAKIARPDGRGVEKLRQR